MINLRSLYPGGNVGGRFSIFMDIPGNRDPPLERRVVYFYRKRREKESPAETGLSKRCNKAIKSLQDWPIRGLSTLRLLNYGQDAIVILWVSECIIGKDVFVFT